MNNISPTGRSCTAKARCPVWSRGNCKNRRECGVLYALQHPSAADAVDVLIGNRHLQLIIDRQTKALVPPRRKMKEAY